MARSGQQAERVAQGTRRSRGTSQSARLLRVPATRAALTHRRAPGQAPTNSPRPARIAQHPRAPSRRLHHTDGPPRHPSEAQGGSDRQRQLLCWSLPGAKTGGSGFQPALSGPRGQAATTSRALPGLFGGAAAYGPGRSRSAVPFGRWAGRPTPRGLLSPGAVRGSDSATSARARQAGARHLERRVRWPPRAPTQPAGGCAGQRRA